MGCFNKKALLVINFIVFAVGVVIVGLASWTISKDNNYTVFLKSGVFELLPIIIIITGLLILLTVFLGCYGALKENSCMLKTYAGIVLILLIAEFVLGILILVYKDKVEEILMKSMDETYNEYGMDDDESLTEYLDLRIQEDLKCCGVRNYTDWENYNYGKLNPGSVPDSCCKNFITGCGKGKLSQPDLFHTSGCYEKIKADISGEATWLSVVCIILALIQVLNISCACGIAKGNTHYA